MGWSLLGGWAEWFWDETVRDVGRRRFHERRRPGTVHEDGTPTPPPRTDRAGFLGQNDPWRLALFGLEGESYATLFHWGRDFNVTVDHLKGTLTRQEVVGPNDSVADRGLKRMLEPSSLEQLVPQPWPDEFSLEGQILEEDMFVAPDLVSLGTDHYKATYDRELGVLLSWQSIIDGQVAHRQTLNAIALLR